jgi:hypothetical protein
MSDLVISLLRNEMVHMGFINPIDFYKKRLSSDPKTNVLIALSHGYGTQCNFCSALIVSENIITRLISSTMRDQQVHRSDFEICNTPISSCASDDDHDCIPFFICQESFQSDQMIQMHQSTSSDPSVFLPAFLVFHNVLPPSVPNDM